MLFVTALLFASPAMSFVVGPVPSVRSASVMHHSKVAMNAIAAKDVKALRDSTGAGMMDCKKALVDSEGDMEAAQEYLRKKGLAIADKKASRKASEGVIETYIHTGAKLGVMVEVNCETDFVARQEKFQELAKNVAMQIAACPTVEFVTQEDIPQSWKDNEIALEMQKEDLLSKPEEIRAKIAEGRVAKVLKTKSLMDQGYIRDGDMTVSDLVTKSVATLGENIKIARFVKFNLGEEQSE